MKLSDCCQCGKMTRTRVKVWTLCLLNKPWPFGHVAIQGSRLLVEVQPLW